MLAETPTERKFTIYIVLIQPANEVKFNIITPQNTFLIFILMVWW